MKKTLLWICAAVMLVLLMPGQVLAAEASDSVSLPVTQTVAGEGSAAANAAVSYTLKAADPSAPMPEGSQNGEYRFTLTGNASFTIPAIRYEKAGVWEYTVSGVYRGETVLPGVVRVTVTVQGNPGALTVTAVAKLPSGEKTELCFRPEVQSTVPTPAPTPKPKPSTPKTGDDRRVTLACAVGLAGFWTFAAAALSLRREERKNRSR